MTTDWLVLALRRLTEGDARGAVEAASEACHHAPRDARAHYAYGQAWMALAELERAEQAFGHTLRLDPKWANAWINYGVVRYRQGEIEDAKTAMRQALLHVPGHPVATANLGAFLRLAGDPEAAEALLQKTIAHEPDNAGARLNLAADLLQAGRHAEVLALLDPAVTPEDLRTARHWHLQRALALIELGRLDASRAALAAVAALGPMPPDLAPLWHWRHALLARAEDDEERARWHAEQMTVTLDTMGPEAVPEHRIMAHYDLAKLFSGWGEDRRAMRHWIAGHALLARIQPFSRARHAGFIDASIAAFGAARFAAGPRAGNRDPAPVFIVGMPRSGTTLCEQILAAHRDVHGAGERRDLGRMFASLGGGLGADAVRRVAAIDAPTLEAAAERYLVELHACAPDRPIVVDKMPGNFMYLGLVGLMLPGTRIIHCVRDPRDIGLSIFTFRFYGDHPYAHDLADLGWAIGEQLRLMAHWRAALPNPILTLRLSDWVRDFDGTLARVLGHLDLPADPACARFYARETRVRTVSREQVRQPVNDSGLGRWCRYAEDLAPLIGELRAANALPEWD